MAGLGLDINFLLSSVSYVLLEKVLSATLPGLVAPGVQTIALVDSSLYVGAMIIVGNPGAANQEIVTVSGITAANFTATFLNVHVAGEMVRGATFSSGQVLQSAIPNISTAATVAPLFTQAELLGYVLDSQNDFIERIRPTYKVGTTNLFTGNPVGTLPSDLVRLDRVDIGGVALWPVSESELDMSEQGAQLSQQQPTMWWWDRLGPSKFAVSPKPPVNLTAELIYSNKATAVPLLTDALVIPDLFWFAIKYAVLAICFSKNGEMRDPRRAAICQKRYDRVIQYTRKFMRTIQLEMEYSKLASAGVGV